MKRFLVLAVMLVPVVAQPKTTAAPSKTAVKAAPKKVAEPAGAGVPKGAVEVSPNVFKFTDKAGKKWIYHRTPFGYSKAEEQTAAASSAAAQLSAAASPATQITEQGDAVKFVRPGPFGNYTWVKKIADLDDSEKGLLDASRKRAEQAKAQDTNQPNQTEPKKEQ